MLALKPPPTASTAGASCAPCWEQGRGCSGAGERSGFGCLRRQGGRPALDVPRLTGRTPALLVKTLLGRIWEARAHLYASFHSGRREHGPERMPMPIARETTGVSRRSQRTYEERAGIEAQHNFAIGEAADAETTPEQAWRQRRGLFQLKDFQGYQGKKGKSYLAWQLPNSYAGGHQKRPKGRQTRINQVLTVLLLKGKTGNGERMVEKRDGARRRTRYYADGKRAAGRFSRHPERDAFWPGNKASGGDFQVWWALCGGE